MVNGDLRVGFVQAGAHHRRCPGRSERHHAQGKPLGSLLLQNATLHQQRRGPGPARAAGLAQRHPARDRPQRRGAGRRTAALCAAAGSRPHLCRWTTTCNSVPALPCWAPAALQTTSLTLDGGLVSAWARAPGLAMDQIGTLSGAAWSMPPCTAARATTPGSARPAARSLWANWPAVTSSPPRRARHPRPDRAAARHRPGRAGRLDPGARWRPPGQRERRHHHRRRRAAQLAAMPACKVASSTTAWWWPRPAASQGRRLRRRRLHGRRALRGGLQPGNSPASVHFHGGNLYFGSNSQLDLEVGPASDQCSTSACCTLKAGCA